MSPDTCKRRPIVLFDAVGTLIRPTPSVTSVYHSTGMAHGSSLSKSEIGDRFRNAFQRIFASTHHSYQRPTDESLELERWQQVVRHVFDQDYSNDLFDDLWTHFAKPQNWELYPRVSEALDVLIGTDIKVGVASNFDNRLAPLIRELLPQIAEDMIFASTQVGYSKPDVRFYKRIEQTLEERYSSVNLMMVGDHWFLDVDAARRAGWLSIWKQEESLPNPNELSAYFFRNT